jgi:hypothetical protein
MTTLSGQRFVGASQADEMKQQRSKSLANAGTM